MSKVKFEIGDKVVSIKDSELLKGVVKNVYPVNPPVLAIEYEDGTVEKVFYDTVAHEPKMETQEKTEPVEKSEITIAPDEFREIASRVIAKETKDNYLVGYAFASIVGEIYKALFIESYERDNFFN